MGTKGKSKILLVDDNSQVIASISSSLAKEGYFVTAYSDTNEAAATVKGEDFDVVLTDIQMPEIKGIDLLEKIHRINPQLPVILMTAYPDFNIALDAIRKKAFDIIIKPCNADYLVQAVKKAVQYNSYLKLKEDYRRSLENMVMEKTQELGLERRQTEGISRDLIGCLTKVAEFGDDEAKAHGTRVGLFSELISKSLGMPLDFVRNIRISSQLHDIGKIGITDNILLKPGSLTTEELEIVKTHTTEGRKLLTGSLHPALKMAESIALNHHERWNGTGYPEGLKMEDIPLEGRIVMIADQYDVIRTRKPYKSASGHEEAFKIITEGDGRTSPEHFDPQVLDAFIEVSPKLDELYNAY
jgi:putative two-component system response regulator